MCFLDHASLSCSQNSKQRKKGGGELVGAVLEPLRTSKEILWDDMQQGIVHCDAAMCLGRQQKQRHQQQQQ